MGVDLIEIDHRPYPPPHRRAWAVSMRWHDLLFAHWRVEARALAALVPPGLEIETFDGSAWLGVIPFTMSGVRHRLLPAVPGVSAFPELNVRTYVRAERDGRAGVWFFSLDAGSRVAVWAARRGFGLAYMDARMRVERCGSGVRYESRRRGAWGGWGAWDTLAYGPTATTRAEFEGVYEGTGAEAPPARGSLEDFLTNRYCLYAWKRGALVRGEIHHGPWGLRAGRAQIGVNTMAAPLGIEAAELERRGGPAVLHYARGMEVVAWMPERV